MKTLSAITVATTLFLSFSASADTIQFKPLDESLATKACEAAATEGLNAAEKLVKEKGVNYSKFRMSVTCNGLSLPAFANRYYEPSLEVGEMRTVKLVAKNESVESRLCLAAVSIGELAAREKYGILQQPIICNDLPLDRFVRKFANQGIQVASIDE